MYIKKTFQIMLSAVLAIACTGFASAAASYPERPIKLLVGFSPGAATDTLTRFYAKKMSDKLGQTVVVETRTGSGGNIAVQAVAQSKPDGYTLVMGANYIAVNAALKRNPYNWESDLTPVSLVASISNLLVVPADSTARTVMDLVNESKQKKKPLTFGSAGVGTSMHMSGELLKALTAVDMQHVAYRGAAPAELDLVAGRIDLMFDSIATAMPLVSSGKLRALAVSGTQRIKFFPDVPTVEEAGIKGFDVTGTYIILAPANLPKGIAQKLSAVIAEISAERDTQEFVDTLYATVLVGGPSEAARVLKEEFEKWQRVVTLTGIKVD